MNRDDKVPASSADALSIGALSRATRVPVETLRTWERRYGVPEPTRKPSGHRLYPATAVEHLRRVTALLESGHRPADVLKLSLGELDSLLVLSGKPGSGARGPAARTAREAGPAAPAIRGMITAAMNFDRDTLVRELRIGWSRLGPLRFLAECAGPFMTEVGGAWEGGTLDIRHEHFASSCLNGFLREVREPYDDRAGGRRVLAATLEGDKHEGGLLMAALVIAMRGGRVVYLGPDSPVGQIVAAARGAKAEVVALSVSGAVRRPPAANSVALLRGKLPRRVELWVGGAGSPPAAAGVERFESLEALDRRLGES